MSSQYPGTPSPGMQPTAPDGIVPLWAPWYGASFAVAFTRFWRKYATFSGRASRSEFWWWILVTFVVSGALTSLSSALGFAPAHPFSVIPGPGFAFVGGLDGLWGLATIVPMLALIWRRLHDTNLSGGFFFLSLIPLAGPIILVVLTLLPPSPGGVRFDRPEYPTPYPPNMPFPPQNQ